MTDKKEGILHTALELFSKEGYNVVSTSRIAAKAGVSEGLIFRHFKNKKGLLDAIVADAESSLGEITATILEERDPRQVIRKAIFLPYSVNEDHYVYWRLIFKLKWDVEYNNPGKMRPFLEKLEHAFSELGYANPEKEAALLSGIIDMTAIQLLRDGIPLTTEYRNFLLNKYNV